MMDRNTLTALLLITLVLILTPYYMEMVSPTVPILEESIDEKPEQETQSVEYREYESDTDDRNELITSLKKTEETTIKIENDLYIATISSACGGSIKSFEIASSKATAFAAIVCIIGPPCIPGKTDLSIFLENSFFAKIKPPLGPLNVL